MPQKKYPDVETYLTDFHGETRKRIDTIRAIILNLMPDATERISYNIPAYFLGPDMVVYFAGYENHVSLYPLHLIDSKDQTLFAQFASGKATLKLPNKDPLPTELIEQFVGLRINNVTHRTEGAN